MKPLITIFTPTYNRESYLKILYDSLKNQNSQNFQWVIVDDGSEDNTKTLIDSFIKESLFDIIYKKVQNGGKMRAINHGLYLACGEYFFIVDSDDYLSENATELIEKYGADLPKEFGGLVFRKHNISGYNFPEFPQEVIDSKKGIIPKKVPSHWYNYKEVKIKDTDSEEVVNQKLYNQKLLSDKKPYFFIYNYPTLMNKYKKYIRDCNTNCAIRFGLTVDELRLKENKSKEEFKFLKYYDMRMPISFEKSLMNRLCWILEKEFDEISTKYKNIGFDTSIIKTGIKYSNSLAEKIKEVYGKYSKAVREKFYVGTENETSRPVFIESMKREIESVCTNDEMICEALIDICYINNSSKQFVWDMCGDVIVERLFRSNNHEFYIPKETLDIENSTLWQGKYYKLVKYKRGEE